MCDLGAGAATASESRMGCSGAAVLGNGRHGLKWGLAGMHASLDLGLELNEEVCG